jgi:hypothetical protein
MITWKKSSEGFTESHCGKWNITPEYWSCVKPQAYSLWVKIDEKWNKVSYGCNTQKEAKQLAQEIEHKYR